VSVTVEKALQLIEALSRSPGPVGVSQLGRDLQLNKSTVYRLVDTLCRNGYARQDPDSGRYALTTKLWELGIGVVSGLGLRQTARPVLEREAAETGESTMIGVLQDLQALILDKVDSSRPLQISSPLGSRVPLHCSSIGRVLLAFQPEPVIAAVAETFQPRTPSGLQTAAALLEDLERVRREGCCRSVDEWEIGIAGVAAPIRDQSGTVAASFCITGPTSRLGPERLPDLQARCIAAAAAVSEHMGYRGR
jgi:DNA-binding IclR family transcriptional regulator